MTDGGLCDVLFTRRVAGHVSDASPDGRRDHTSGEMMELPMKYSRCVHSAPVRDRRQALLGGLFIVVVVLAGYANSFHGAFVYDDHVDIVQNYHLRRPWPPWRLFLSPDTGAVFASRPLVNLSLAFNYTVAGLAPESYHVVNITIHLLAALILFALIRHTLGRPGLETVFSRHRCLLSALVAVIWAIHPLQTESVTYIIQRLESMMGLAFLLVVYLSAKGFAARERGRWHAAAAAVFILGLGIKEVIAVAPLVVLLYDMTFESHSLTVALRRSRGLYLAFGVGTLIFLVFLWLGDTLRVVSMRPNFTAWDYMRTQPLVLTHYGRLLLWPDRLCICYSDWPPASPGETLVGLALFIALGIAVVDGLQKRRAAGFLGACFMICLAPSSSFVPLRMMAAEHRMYLASAAPIIFIVTGGYWLWRKWQDGGRAKRTVGWVGLAVLLAIVGTLSWRTHLRNLDYRDEMALWQATLAISPDNTGALQGIGKVLLDRGRPRQALAYFRRALSIRSDLPKVINDLGVAHYQLDELDEAQACFQKALAIDPDRYKTLNNLGALWARRNNLQRALELMDKALSIRPGYLPALVNSATALLDLRRPALALRRLEKAMRLDPENAMALKRAGQALVMLERPKEALLRLERALRLDASDDELLFDLATAHLMSGNPAEARRFYERSAALNGLRPETHANLGVVLVRLGNTAAGIRHLEKALQLNPDLVTVRDNLERLKKAQPAVRFDPGSNGPGRWPGWLGSTVRSP